MRRQNATAKSARDHCLCQWCTYMVQLIGASTIITIVTKPQWLLAVAGIQCISLLMEHAAGASVCALPRPSHCNLPQLSDCNTHPATLA